MDNITATRTPFSSQSPLAIATPADKSLSANDLKGCLRDICEPARQVTTEELEKFFQQAENLLSTFSINDLSHQQFFKALIFHEPRLKQLVQKHQLPVLLQKILALRNAILAQQLDHFETMLQQKDLDRAYQVDETLSSLLPFFTQIPEPLSHKQKKVYCLLVTKFRELGSIEPKHTQTLRRKCWKWTIRLVACPHILKTEKESAFILKTLEHIRPITQQPGTPLLHLLTILLEGEVTGENKLPERWCTFFQKQIQILLHAKKWRSCYELLHLLCDSQKKAAFNEFKAIATKEPAPLSEREKVFLESAKNLFRLASREAPSHAEEALLGEELYSIAFLYKSSFDSTSFTVYMTRIPELPEYCLKLKRKKEGKIGNIHPKEIAALRVSILAGCGFHLLRDSAMGQQGQIAKKFPDNFEFLTSVNSNKTSVISHIAQYATEEEKTLFFAEFFDHFLLYLKLTDQKTKDVQALLERSLKFENQVNEFLLALFCQRLFRVLHTHIYFAEIQDLRLFSEIILFISQHGGDWSKKSSIKKELATWTKRILQMPEGEELSIHQAAVTLETEEKMLFYTSAIQLENYPKIILKALEFIVADKALDKIDIPRLKQAFCKFFQQGRFSNLSQQTAGFEFLLKHWESADLKSLTAGSFKKIATYFPVIFIQIKFQVFDELKQKLIQIEKEKVSFYKKSLELFIKKLLKEPNPNTYFLFEEDVVRCLAIYLNHMARNADQNEFGGYIVHILIVLSMLKSKEGFHEAKLNHLVEDIFPLFGAKRFQMGHQKLSAIEVLQVDDKTGKTAAAILRPFIQGFAHYSYQKNDPSQFATLLSHCKLPTKEDKEDTYTPELLKVSVEALIEVLSLHAKASNQECKEASTRANNKIKGFVKCAQSQFELLRGKNATLAASVEVKLNEVLSQLYDFKLIKRASSKHTLV